MENVVLGMENNEEMVEEKEEAKPLKSPFAIWSVGGKDYKLVLRTAEICAIEQKLGKNLLDIFTDDNLPPLSTMLTVAQAALKKYHHGLKFTDVQAMYDKYTEEGNTQTDFLSDVFIPIYEASGFFTKEMTDTLKESMDEI